MVVLDAWPVHGKRSETAGVAMTVVEDLLEEVRRGGAVLLDGAVGTECERRGAPQLEGAWNGGAALSNPEVVQAVHADYLALGARVLIANTFATHRHALAVAGVEHDFVAYNRRGVELALAARTEAGAEGAVVAGSISNWTWVGEHPDEETLRRNSAEQAAVLRDAGAELVVLEMMIDITRMRATLEGALTAGLPVWVGLTCGTNEGRPVTDDGVPRLRDGEALVDAIASLAAYDVGAVLVMHTDVRLVEDCLEVAREAWAGPLGVYAHSGDYVEGRWVYDAQISPGSYRDHAERWRDHGAGLIGGCCGIGPDHVRALAGLLAGPSTPTTGS